jgi:hypothetical protein
MIKKPHGLPEKENYTLKLSLLKEVKKLSKCTGEDLPRIARELKIIRLNWKDIGNVPENKSEELWDMFSEESDKLQARISEYYDKLEESRKLVALEKIKLCEEAEKIQSSTEWEKTAKVLKDIQKQWQEVGFTAPEQEKELYMRFRDACDVFFTTRKDYYHKIKSKREDINSVKFQLCEEAKTIFDLNYSDAHQLIPQLWARWKAAGSAGKSDRKLYDRFRGYFDTYYDEQRKQRSKNLEIKKKLCEKLKFIENFLSNNQKQFQDIKSEYSEIKMQWDLTGATPRAEEPPVLKEYLKLTKKIASFRSKDNKKKLLKKSFELEQIVSAALDSLDSKKIEIWNKCQEDWGNLDCEEKMYFRDSFDTITSTFENEAGEYHKKLLGNSEENLAKRKEICTELEGLGIKATKEATNEDMAAELSKAIADNFASDSEKQNPVNIEKVEELIERWLKGGVVPQKALAQLYESFEQAVENINVNQEQE